MPIKISRNVKRLTALKITEIAKPIFFRLLKGFIVDEIKSSIESGRSPVNRGGTLPSGTSGSLRYEKYSESYTDNMGKGELKGKKRSPINLTLTGKMLRSMKYRITRNYFKVWFTDPKAKYHDKLGAGKKKVIRRLLPHTGEDFNAGLRKRIANALVNAIKLSKR